MKGQKRMVGGQYILPPLVVVLDLKTSQLEAESLSLINTLVIFKLTLIVS